ncbi:complex I assembly factor TMEM126B, mitochondrial isoform X2 [Monodelphis domestica]|uniref:complex I assembly factor TMEM126B, mitochondrial isoform X2 n=1 Tax=Monodelphis domestica TaxID=13616 RepID=UPI0024E1A8DC|nr:complex I assembly factor TMEM126B, mitochondrial isoform X2 [Monodelphis domestica]
MLPGPVICLYPILGDRMTAHTYIQSDSSPEVTQGRLKTADIVEKNLWRLTRSDQNLYTYGPLYIGTTSSCCGILANYLFRNCMKVKQHPFQTFVPLSAIPFLTTAVTYKFLVTDYISSGELTVDSCILRGAFVSAICGVFHPSALAFFKNGRLAVRYETVPLPPRGRVLYHWTLLCQSAAKLMIIPMVIQIMYGGNLAFLQYTIFKRLFQLLEHD